jgi:hypothetical protein
VYESSVRLTGDSTCCLRDIKRSLIYYTGGVILYYWSHNKYKSRRVILSHYESTMNFDLLQLREREIDHESYAEHKYNDMNHKTPFMYYSPCPFRHGVSILNWRMDSGTLHMRAVAFVVSRGAVNPTHNPESKGQDLVDPIFWVIIFAFIVSGLML